MRRHRIGKVVKFGVMGLLAAGLFGFVVMSLWNWLMPAVFGWHAIRFTQAIGLLVLSKILFGGFRGGGRMGSSGPGSHWRRRVIEKWEAMTPEEREKFRQGMQRGGGRCGSFGPPLADPKV